MDTDLATDLAAHARFLWVEGMCDQHGRRVVDASLVTPDLIPDLADMATAGRLLEQIDAMGVLTDIVRSEGEWIVAVELPSELKGFASDHLGEAAAWALLEAWAELGPAYTDN